MDDLISRHKVIEIINDAVFVCVVDTGNFHQAVLNAVEETKKFLAECIEELPSVQPKTQLSTKGTTLDTTFDCISRQAAIDAIEILLEQSEDDEHDKTWNNAIRGSIKAVKHHVPSAQPERKTGKWIKHSIGHEHTPWGFDCSECGEWFVIGEEVIKKYNYCPNCGSYNRGDNHEADTKAS